MSNYPIVDLSTDALEIAVQAPTSSNVQNWSFIVVTDGEQRRAIGDVYRRKCARAKLLLQRVGLAAAAGINSTATAFG